MKAILKAQSPSNSSNYFNQVVGIIGGVGPEATNYFISLLIKLRRDDAKKDQEHIPYLAFNNPQIPDRTEHLVNGKQNPVPEIIHTGKILKNAGAKFLAIPCNTCHAYIEEIEREVGLKVLNMIELTAKHIVQNYGEKIKIGLLATDGTIKSKIYQSELKKIAPKATLMTPTQKTQKKVMKAIYEIKSTSVNESNFRMLYEAAEEHIKNGASVVILGCTEIPLALTKNKRIFPVVDPMEVLAKAVIQRTLATKISPPKRLWPFNPATI